MADTVFARVLWPQDGSVLHRRHGTVCADGLKVPVRVECPGAGEREIWIAGQRASRGGGLGEALLRAAEEEIEVRIDSPRGPVIARTRVVFVRNSRPRYRLAIDDNIFFLRAIARDLPGSIFECFYLDGLRDLNRRYGTKFALNLFYSTPEGDFTLDRFPDRYRGEFADNADWLTLAFHAEAEFPDRPYQQCTPERLAAEYDRVASEILRFAGEEAYSPTTITHWAMVHPDAWSVLAERGSRVLSGFFVPKQETQHTGDGEGLARGTDEDEYDVNYCLDRQRSVLLNGRDLLKDFSTGLLFSKIELVCNNTPADRAAPILARLKEHPDTAEVMDLVTHEQYFWPHYPNHLPDHFARCEAAIRWCAENGYEPVFLHRGLAGVEP